MPFLAKLSMRSRVSWQRSRRSQSACGRHLHIVSPPLVLLSRCSIVCCGEFLLQIHRALSAATLLVEYCSALFSYPRMSRIQLANEVCLKNSHLAGSTCCFCVEHRNSLAYALLWRDDIAQEIISFQSNIYQRWNVCPLQHSILVKLFTAPLDAQSRIQIAKFVQFERIWNVIAYQSFL